MRINLKYSHFKAIFPKTNSLVFCFLSKKVIIENESNENQLSLTDENEQNPKLEPIEIKEEKEEMLSSNENLPDKDSSCSNPIESSSTDQFLHSCPTSESNSSSRTNSETKTETIKVNISFQTKKQQ